MSEENRILPMLAGLLLGALSATQRQRTEQQPRQHRQNTVFLRHAASLPILIVGLCQTRDP